MFYEHLTIPNGEVALVLFKEYIDGVTVAQWKRTYLKHKNLHSDDEDDDDEGESGMSVDLCSSSTEGEFEALKSKPECGPKLFYCVLEAVKQVVLSIFFSLLSIFSRFAWNHRNQLSRCCPSGCPSSKHNYLPECQITPRSRFHRFRDEEMQAE